MAKSSKTKTGKSKSNDVTADKVESVDADVANEAKVNTSPAEPSVETLADDIPDDEDGIDLLVDDSSDLDLEVDEEPLDTFVSPADPHVPVENATSNFMPLALGGVVAGAIGYGVATFFPLFGNDDGMAAKLSDQSAQIAALEAQIASIPAPDLSGLEAQIADLSGDTTTQINTASDSLSAQLTALDARLSELEKQPNSDGTLSDSALAAYQRELEDLRAEVDAQQASVMTAAAQAEADLVAARAEAEALEQEALAASEAAATRAALNRVATAVETGAPFDDALRSLNIPDLPAALTAAAETGVATTAQLTADFPAVARAALATARAEGVSDDASGIGGFLRSQFDVRSTAPQEGPGPDAVLSRAEAAAKEGRISDALAELEALPEVARAELTDWTARATQRADVLNAIATLSETYN